MSLFPQTINANVPKSRLKDIAVRDFGGGWNTLDDDISMNTRYLPDVLNFHRTASGAQELRFGTQYFANVADTVNGDIVDVDYFNGRIVAVMTSGEVVTIDDDGIKTKIWDSDIALLLPGAPSGWSAGLTQCDFVPFKDTLVIHNGVDKPISVAQNFAVTYLQDLATGSNVNVPIGKYGCVVSNYHVVAGIEDELTTIYIASVGTAGVFPGDAPPNDSISLDVGAYTSGGAEIIGIAGFKTRLFVFFRGETVTITLGTYNSGGDHVPAIDEDIPPCGLLSHRCIVHHDNDLVFADVIGASGARRNLYAGLLDSTRLSDLVSTAYQGTMGALEPAQMLDCFMVLDRLGNEVMIFEPNSGKVFVRSASERLKYQAWTQYGGLDFTCGCTSFLGRVFFGSGTKIFQYGNKPYGETYRADRLGDFDAAWMLNTLYTEGDLIIDSDDTVYECSVTHTSAATGTFTEDREDNPENWTEYTGRAISFYMETPWMDGRAAMRLKHMRYANVATKGDARFALDIYVDNLYKDVDGNVTHDPALSLELIGNDAAGFGEDVEAFGGGRRSMDPRLWRYPVKFKMAKFRIHGETKRPLQVMSYNFLYAIGAFKR